VYDSLSVFVFEARFGFRFRIPPTAPVDCYGQESEEHKVYGKHRSDGFAQRLANGVFARLELGPRRYQDGLLRGTRNAVVLVEGS
jgi:hypothetical protein